MKPSTKAKLDPRYAEITPGEILLTEFLQPLGITAYRLAHETGMPRSRVSDILKGKRSITADTALAFSVYFGNSAQFWLNLQSHYDLEKATRENLEKIKARVKPLQAA